MFLQTSCKKVMEKIRVAVIDTNVDLSHPVLQGAKITIDYANGIIANSEAKSKGHGTAVCSIIYRANPMVDITVYPIFSDLETVEAEMIITLLDYINRNEQYNMINMSIGTTICEDRDAFEMICHQLALKGTILVAAYDNAGIMSYPACFSDVIGVDISPNIVKAKEFEVVENSLINIRGCCKQQRLPWDNPRYVFASGTSFVVPYIVGQLVDIMLAGEINSKQEAMCELKKRASNVREFSETKPYHKMPQINKAIVFPFNKEIHSMVKYCDMLNFELLDVYDVKHFMRVGKTVSSVLKQSLDKDFIIKNIEHIKWDDDFDTVIIGHISEMVKSMGASVFANVIDQACRNKKKIYTFDAYIQNNLIKDSYENCFYPSVERENVPLNSFGKMWCSQTPVIGVFGTRSKQGKFTMQLAIKRLLAERGYTVGQISTEPSGVLFNADYVFPFGYGSTIKVNHEEAVLVLNDMIHKIEVKGVDIILVGCQSGTVPYDVHNVSRLLFGQTAFMYGTLPDCVILCVSPDDEIEYIKRTMDFLEAAIQCKVIALAVYPIALEPFLVSGFKPKNLSKSDFLIGFMRKLEEICGVPVYEQHPDSYGEIVDAIIDFF